MCGRGDRRNKASRKAFKCRECGFTFNASALRA
uniref:Uncharacterized protein n=1 Tax=Fervidicoccus fontis TaxID=683846 RepID=A0A7J3ZLP0_9CREN